MLLRMKQLPGVDNLRNYPAEIIKELEELLLSGGSALPDPKRKGFYDLETDERTFFVHVSPTTGRVMLLATWLRPEACLKASDAQGREPIVIGKSLAGVSAVTSKCDADHCFCLRTAVLLLA